MPHTARVDASAKGNVHAAAMCFTTTKANTTRDTHQRQEARINEKLIIGAVSFFRGRQQQHGGAVLPEGSGKRVLEPGIRTEYVTKPMANQRCHYCTEEMNSCCTLLLFANHKIAPVDQQRLSVTRRTASPNRQTPSVIPKHGPMNASRYRLGHQQHQTSEAVLSGVNMGQEPAAPKAPKMMRQPGLRNMVNMEREGELGNGKWRWKHPESFSGVVFPAIEKVDVASNYDTTVFASMPSVPKQQSKASSHQTQVDDPIRASRGYAFRCEAPASSAHKEAMLKTRESNAQPIPPE